MAVNEDVQAVIDAINHIRTECSASVAEAHGIYGLYISERKLRVDQEHNELHQREAALALSQQRRGIEVVEDAVAHA